MWKSCYNGIDVTNLRPDQKFKKGNCFCIQDGLIFPAFTVAEQLKRMQLYEMQPDTAFDYFPELKGFGSEHAGNLSGGQRQMLSLSMLLMQKNSKV